MEKWHKEREITQTQLSTKEDKKIAENLEILKSLADLVAWK